MTTPLTTPDEDPNWADYAHLIDNRGLDITELVNDPNRADFFANFPVALIGAEVKAQLRLLNRLLRDGLLRKPAVSTSQLDRNDGTIDTAGTDTQNDGDA